jgi:hypothetical protein
MKYKKMNAKGGGGNPNSISARWLNGRTHPRTGGGSKRGEMSMIEISAKLPKDWIAGFTVYVVAEIASYK